MTSRLSTAWRMHFRQQRRGTLHSTHTVMAPFIKALSWLLGAHSTLFDSHSMPSLKGLI